MTENGSQMFMPVAPAYSAGGGFGGGFGSYGGDFWLILILLFAFGGFGGYGGFGGWGGMGGFAADGAMLYPWMNQAEITTNGFQNQALNTAISGLQNSVTAGFGDVQLGIAGINQNLCQTGSGIVQAVNNGFSQAEIANNSRQIANMQQAFAAQTAMNQGFNGVQSQLANCCCENRAGIADLKYTVATENCADRQTSTQNTQAILTALNSGVQSIKDQLCSDKIEQKNDTIAQLRSELMYARGQASQDVQTAAIQAGQRNLANEVEQYVAPRAIPAYVVQNPSCCNQNYYGCGCGCGM
jgi:hypothetical protein